jgi:hypothetical protein
MMRQLFRWTPWTALLLLIVGMTACGFDPAVDSPSGKLQSSKQALSLIPKKNLLNPTLPKICSLNKHCKSNEYCKKSSCAISVGVCTARPTSCVFTPKGPVTGCNNVNYYNACYAALAGQSTYKKQWVNRVNPSTCTGNSARFGYLDYPNYSFIAAAPGEHGHYAATTFTPPSGQVPYKVSKVSYDLVNATLPGAPLHNRPDDHMCNAGLAHEVLLFVVPANSPPTTSPVILRTIPVNQTSAQPVPGNSKTRTFTHNFAPITLQAGQKLVVAIKMTGDNTQTNILCLGQCYDPNLVPREYWSFAHNAPFNWQPSSVWRRAKDGFRVRIYTQY